MTCGGLQRAFLSRASDRDRGMRPLHRLRFAASVRELHVFPGEVRFGLGEKRDDRFDAFTETIETLFEWR